ncbi:hypothetical protein PR048_015922 [Dryococelus australis]|uniref:Uncharacterized protein n=1 Tax=Dryococelus australis TaxID=614101 RepID=A0ABQ9HIN1_9NEOP|nr:hypothetical protein PR048_015922 [Dryococelus australis]
MGNIVEVQKYFQNVHKAHGWLLEKDCVIPQLPHETRWNSQPDCTEKFPLNMPKTFIQMLQDLNQPVNLPRSSVS